MFGRRLTPEEKIARIKQYELDMYRVAKGILGDEEDCKDALQETILRAYQQIEKVKEQQYIKTWLIRITINECNRVYQKRQRNRQIIPFKITEESSSIEQEEIMDIQQGVEQLPEQYKTPVVLHYYSGCNYEEIAKVMDIPVGTVKSRMSKARQLLKEYLGGGWNE